MQKNGPQVKSFTTLKTKTSREIFASRVGIGFECLDRQMWEDSEEVYRYAGELGVKFARVQTGWARTETEPGIYDFVWLDKIVDRLLSEGIKPWLSISYGNPLYIKCEGKDGVGNHPMHSKTAQTAWCRYVAALVQHFNQRTDLYEIWNEGDSNAFWKPGANPGEHVELMRITSGVVRQYAPDATVIGGAFANGLTVVGFDLIRQHLECGMADYLDAFSFHHYKTVIELERPDFLQKLRTMFAEFGKPDIQLWQGEGGFPSQTSKTQALKQVPVTEDIQAQMLLRYVINDLAMDVDLTSYFQISDFKFYSFGGICREPNYFGVLTFDQPPRRKLSYYVLQRLASLFDVETRLEQSAVVELYSCDEDAESKRYSFPVEAMKAAKTVFMRRGYPMISYHRVANIIEGDVRKESINLDAWIAKASFSDPVLIDPMTGNVYDGLEFTPAGRKCSFKNLPLEAYPLLLTDRDAINDLLSSGDKEENI